MSLDPALLPSLAWFSRIAAHRSFTRAAAELGVSRAALSQSLKALERRLEVKLLHRTTRAMSLTEEGQHLLDAVRPALDGIERAARDVGETRGVPSGQLRVNTSRIAARTLLEPFLPEFLGRFPRLRLELVLDDGLTDIVREGCDAGIRLGERLAEHMVAVPITPRLEMAVVGSPGYLKARGRPTAPADLVGHDCLSFRFPSGGLFRWEFTSPGAGQHELTVEPQGSLVTNDDDQMIRAAVQGLGLAQHLDVAVREHLEAGTLVRVLKAWCRPFPGFYLYVPSREQMAPKVRALVDFLVEKRRRL